MWISGFPRYALNPNAQFCTVRRGSRTYRAASRLVYEGRVRGSRPPYNSHRFRA